MLIDTQTLLIFMPAALALNLMPGADMLFCLGRGMRNGPRAGIGASLGIATGSLIHSLLAGLGLAALIATNPALFEVLRWAGIAYLVWLAIQALRSTGELTPQGASAGGAWLGWRDGILVNLLNPKVAIFILAFVPQFVDPARGSPFLQFLVFGVLLNVCGTPINCLVGAFSGSLGRWLTRSRRAAQALQYLSSIIFLGLAARLAFDRR